MKFTVFDFDKRTPRGVLRMNDTIGSRKRFEMAVLVSKQAFGKSQKGLLWVHQRLRPIRLGCQGASSARCRLS